jgi:hypothetical protein
MVTRPQQEQTMPIGAISAQEASTISTRYAHIEHAGKGVLPSAAYAMVSSALSQTFDAIRKVAEEEGGTKVITDMTVPIKYPSSMKETEAVALDTVKRELEKLGYKDVELISFGEVGNMSGRMLQLCVKASW